MTDVEALLDGLAAGDHRSLARAITILENEGAGHRALRAGLYARSATAGVVGVTGSPGVGKSTLVDAMVEASRERGETVGVLAVDPASPFSGGALLGDRIRLGSAAGDDGVFARSMSARGASGGLAAATVDAVRALSVAGLDRIVVETVGAGQGEVDVVEIADTVLVVIQPGSGDGVQALKAGILEIGDVYVVNKADRKGADRAVRDLREMVEAAGELGSHRAEGAPSDHGWKPPVVETVATTGAGVGDLLEAIDDHREFLAEGGLAEAAARRRLAAALRANVAAAVDTRVDRRLDDLGGIDALAGRLEAGEVGIDEVVDRLLDPPTGPPPEGEPASDREG